MLFPLLKNVGPQSSHPRILRVHPAPVTVMFARLLGTLQWIVKENKWNLIVVIFAVIVVVPIILDCLYNHFPTKFHRRHLFIFCSYCLLLQKFFLCPWWIWWDTTSGRFVAFRFLFHVLAASRCTRRPTFSEAFSFRSNSQPFSLSIWWLWRKLQ